VRRSVEFRAAPPESLDTAAVVLPLPEGSSAADPAVRPFDAWMGGGLGRRLAEGGFRGRADETAFFPGPDGGRPHLVAVGLGKPDEVDPEAVRAAAGRAVDATRRERLDSVAFVLPAAGAVDGPAAARAAAEGLVLGDWSYDDLRTGGGSGEPRPEPPARAVVACPPEIRPVEGGEEAAVGRGAVLATSQNWTRELVARPPNVATPTYLARRARELAGEHDRLEVEVRGRDRLREEGFGALLAVSSGSAQEPCFITLDYRGAETGRPTVLLGKGITFDSGGISLKPSEGMEEMKYDMAGAAAVMGCMRAVATLDLPVRVVGLVPSAENLPSGTALKPSDVVRGLSGRSIEVVNTDAEGRLLLSDALEFGRRLAPETMVDVATLTGGCVVALGSHAIGLMANDDELADALVASGGRTGERAWRLPLHPEYREQLDSDIADIKNSGGREASAITAGWFLKEFVGDVSWAHLDIAGTAWTDERRGYQPEGATGVGVRLLTDWLMSGL
jgi:leucyl aminopeptidase